MKASMAIRLWIIMIAGCLGCSGNLSSKPQHVTTSIGSDATFRCVSDKPNKFRWTFRTRDGKTVDETNKPSRITYANGIISIHSVMRDDSGMIFCEDKNEASFAQLTVVESKGTQLSLCPMDRVAVVGDTVVLEAATTPDESIRWYKYITDKSKWVVIYTGDEFDYTFADYRYDVTSSRDGQKNLVISKVLPDDATVYIAKDETIAVQASGSLSVIDSSSTFVRLEPSTINTMILNCVVNIATPTPTRFRLQWMNTLDVSTLQFNHSTDPTGRFTILESRLVQSPSKVWPTCQLTSELRRCNETFDVYKYDVPATPQSICYDEDLYFLIPNQYLWIGLGIVASILVYAFITTICAVRFYHKSQQDSLYQQISCHQKCHLWPTLTAKLCNVAKHWTALKQPQLTQIYQPPSYNNFQSTTNCSYRENHSTQTQPVLLKLVQDT